MFRGDPVSLSRARRPPEAGAHDRSNIRQHARSDVDATEAQMAKVIYTAKAAVTGGREKGRGVSEDGALDVQLRPPTEGGGTNPEQLFAVGYAACFEGAIGAVGRRERLEVGD